MKNKILLTVLACSLAVSGLAFSACTPQSEINHIEAKNSTCTQNGNIEYWELNGKYYSDADCTKEISQKDTVLDKLEHSVDGVQWSSDGTKHYHLCKYNCGTHVDEATCTPAAEYVITDATYHWKNCTLCGNEVNSTKDSHNFVWVTDEEAQVGAAGKRHEECSTCHAVRNENTEIPALTVKYHKPESPTCSKKGNSEYWELGGKYYSDEECTVEIELSSVEIETVAHSAEENAQWSSDGTKHYHLCKYDCGTHVDEVACTENAAFVTTDSAEHWKTCLVCNGVINSTKQAHAFVWVTDTPAQVGVAGVKHEECSVCHKTQNENTEIPPLVSKHHEANAPTCTEDGNVEYWEFDGKYYSDAACTTEITSIIAPATGHSATGAQWTVAGGKHYHICVNGCGTRLDEAACTPADSFTGDADGHFHACTVCGAETDKAAHDKLSSAFKEVAEATNGGWFYKSCSVCGYVSEELLYPDFPNDAYADRTVKVGGNTYGAYSCYADANLKNKGVTFACENDGLFIIDLSKFASGVAVEITNNAVKLIAGVDTEITLTNSGNKSVEVAGGGTLTVNGGFTGNNGVTLTVNGKLVINGNLCSDGSYVGMLAVNEGGSLTVNGGAYAGTAVLKGNSTFENFSVAYLTVGDAEGKSSPDVLINNKLDNFLYGHPAATYRFLSGNTVIEYNKTDKVVYVGLELNTATAHSVEIGAGASLKISKFNFGINHGDAGSGEFNLIVNGRLEISASEVGIQNQSTAKTLNVTVNAGGVLLVSAAGGGDNAVMNNVNVTVDGGALQITAAAWGFNGGAVTFNSGKAVLLKDGNGYASFNNVNSITVADGFDLGIKNFSRVIFGSTADENITVNQLITLENIGELSQDTHMQENVNYVLGTVEEITQN